MPSTYASTKFTKLTSDGTANGVLTIADNTGWLPGAIVWLIDDNSAGIPLQIVEQIGTTQIRVRAQNSPNKGAFPSINYSNGVDCTAYTTAQNASLNMEGQVVPVLSTFVPRERA